MNNGCYAQKGHVGIQQKHSVGEFSELTKAAGAGMLRHHVSGDFMRESEDGAVLDIDYLLDVIVFHVMFPHVKGWVYTHAIREIVEAGFTPADIPDNLAMLASCDNADDYVFAKKHGWRTASVTEDGKPTHFGEVSCLHDTRHMKCSQCKICLPNRKADIVFKFK